MPSGPNETRRGLQVPAGTVVHCGGVRTSPGRTPVASVFAGSVEPEVSKNRDRRWLDCKNFEKVQGIPATFLDLGSMCGIYKGIGYLIVLYGTRRSRVRRCEGIRAET